MMRTNPPTETSRLLGIQEVAARLGVSRRTVERLVASNELERIKIRGRVLFRESEVESFIELHANP
ncbi:MAG: helix-turn-helix domain-containing protein [Verrucomicrobiota bacterium JB023]|nr:helix-turn-helix domain-containing protein [Verrucomicrobiota bacterium JB023]